MHGECNFEEKLCYLKTTSSVFFKCYKKIPGSVASRFRDNTGSALATYEHKSSSHVFPKNLL